MKFPDDVQKHLQRRFHNKHREWLAAGAAEERSAANAWPSVIPLDAPTENQALKQLADVQVWVAAWQSWRGSGTLCWSERRWRKLGTQNLPERLALADAAEVARWAGESERWERARQRYLALTRRWPGLAGNLSRYFDLFADYGEADYRRLVELAAWIAAHPASGLYPRQLPVNGMDSKWIESRKTVVADFVDAVRGDAKEEGDFYQRCGLKAPPPLIRLRLLDQDLRQKTGGLGDISVPLEQLAGLDLPVTSVFIVENLQTGLAFTDLPGSVVIMQLGYGVEVLGRLPWIAHSRCIYWGDLDTHGFAILNRARHCLPGLESILMDKATLLNNRDLWVEEKDPHGAESLPMLTRAEQAVYRGLKGNIWGSHIRLEQERIPWDAGWKVLEQMTI